MDMKFTKLLLGSLIALIAPVQAAFACEGSVEFGPSISATGYSPFDPVDKKYLTPLTLENNSQETCRFGLAFERSSIDGELGGELSYSLTYETINLFAAASPQKEPVIVVDVEAGERERLDLEFVIQRGQFVAPGAYSDQVTAYLFLISDQDTVMVNDRQAKISLKVEPDFGINIAGAGQRTTLDFGILEEGAEKNVKLRARSNTNYQLVVSSEHDGQLMLTPAVPGQSWTIPYQLSLDEHSLPLDQSDWSSSPLPVASGGYVEHNLDVIIGETDDKRAGSYRDVVTVKIQAARP